MFECVWFGCNYFLMVFSRLVALPFLFRLIFNSHMSAISIGLVILLLCVLPFKFMVFLSTVDNEKLKYFWERFDCESFKSLIFIAFKAEFWDDCDKWNFLIISRLSIRSQQSFTSYPWMKYRTSTQFDFSLDPSFDELSLTELVLDYTPSITLEWRNRGLLTDII